eukprot:CAMPEP_0182439754 /NCGR_PEP_ID=MMETSP1167-20130531/86625_1 /TAXON_ID=2988 /ORGANISM="Mallomonas Sp, Strain CCMP3275" /LENGTH=2248 /DNA_ID=CAMNT_0024633521 /DNA_START=466 /DNA_END=7213 /DNA_ORIENTATION=-
MAATPTPYLSESTTLKVYDNVVQGDHPLSHEISEMLTGVSYSARVKSYTRGTYHGYSNYSEPQAMGIPSGTPPVIEALKGYSTLFVNEIQQVEIGAANIHEIQNVTTSAPAYADVQEISLTAPETQTISGMFSLRFPEIQAVTLSATSPVTSGSFSLQYSFYSFDNQMILVTDTTSCLSYKATAAEVAIALESLSSGAIDDVEVMRSGTGSYRSRFGYTWSVSFVGNKVAGNVQMLVPVFGGSCASLVSATKDATVTVVDLNRTQAVGTDTESQSLTIGANTMIAQGQYKINITHGGVSLRLTDRTGDGTVASDYGYKLKIYFDGNSFHVRNGTDGSNSVSNITVTQGSGGCLPFAHFMSGVLTEFTSPLSIKFPLILEQNVMNNNGFDMDAVNTTAEILRQRLSVLPSTVQVSDTRRSLSDDRLGHLWTVVFDLSVGDIPDLVCGMNPTLTSVSAKCGHFTLINGNVIGGHFTLTTGAIMPYDVSAVQMQSAFELVYGVNSVSVSRTGPDHQRGYTWLITWITATEEVPPLTYSSSLTGSAVKLEVKTIQPGNFLRGNFSLSYMGVPTVFLPYDVSASVLKSALENVSTIGLVSVSQSYVTQEGGRSFLVTFLNANGDIDSMVPYSGNLKGIGAAVRVFEYIKGSNANGSTVKLSYEAPLYCSSSQVLEGNCGQPITAYSIEIGSSKTAVLQTVTVPVSYDIQKIRMSAPSLFDVGYFEGNDATGFFQIGYRSGVTSPISTDATAVDLRSSIELLPDINSVHVTRTYSGHKLEGTVKAEPGIQFLICLDSCSFETLPPGDLIYIGGDWYRVYQSYKGSTTRLPLAFQNDSSIIASYVGGYTETGTLFRWARGYEWTVTILNVTHTGPISPFMSPKHGINPLDTAVSIRTLDCNNCTYVKNLTVWTQYYVRARALNANGMGPYTSYVPSTPQQIPGPPTSVTVKVVSGSQLDVFFSPPAFPDGTSNITRYTLQWDSSPLFTSAVSSSASCASSGYGYCEITGSSIALSPPYTYLISNLSPSIKYYVRVAARNSVPVQQTDPTGTIPDNTNWSGTVNAITLDQPPGAPVFVAAAVSGPSFVQLQVTPPVRNGGQNITLYIIEWDTSVTFTSTSYGSKTVATNLLLPLFTSGPLAYELSGLTTGQSYWVRVSCVTSIGVGATTTSLSTVTPAGKPDAPAAVSLSTSTLQDTPITKVDVSWTAPSSTGGNGGSAITSYLVEWWTLTNIEEVQLVRFTSDSFPPNVNGSFIMRFGPAPSVSYATGLLQYNLAPINIREGLMNLGYSGVSGVNSNFVIGDLTVRRQTLTGRGYQWSITFNSAQNEGDQVPFAADPLAISGEHVDVVELVTGRRPGGFAERQILSITSSGSNETSALGGWFRLSFNTTSVFTTWLPADATSDEVQRGINSLPSIRVVTVSRAEVHANPAASTPMGGYEWTITFTGDRGNMPVLFLDSDLLTTTATKVNAVVYDGDNAIDTKTGEKATAAFPGELPANYSYQYVSADSRSLSVNNLVTGTAYFFAVSAVNAFGVGPVATSAAGSITPPLQVPQPPTNVSVNVNYGSATTLKVSYSKPTSNGGASITKYRVEVDKSADFSNSIANEFICPAGNLYSAFRIQTSGTLGDPITSGYFTLKLAVNGFTYYTDFIPYDATAKKSDEVGVRVLLPAFTITFASNSVSTMSASVDVSQMLFLNDRVQFGDQADPEKVYTIQSILSSSPYTVTTTEAVVLDSSAALTQSVYRYLGGRGNVQTSKVTCSKDVTICSAERRQTSGSVQSKFEMLTEAITRGVSVDRDEPDATNGVSWRITFLDDSPPAPHNFALSVNESKLVTVGAAAGTVTVTQLVVGQVFSKCTGTYVVPTVKTLANGQYYYGRTFAINEVGFSLPQTGPSPQKPMVVPGVPTSVVLSVVSETALRVTFNPPDSDGGDTITSYLVEYALKSDFSNTQNTTVTYLAGGPPFFKTIEGLTKGLRYYIRVSAGNTQGYGTPTASTPASQNPYQESNGPTGVFLRVTSNTMLTVSFAYPEDDGGDVITGYRIEWDVVNLFNSVASSPNKGYADVDATTDLSYTIQYLTEGITYYVRVFARNSAGLGRATLSSPRGIAPALQIPGKPHTIIATTGSVPGTINLSWQRPRVPWHDIQCSGLPSAPNDCPVAVGDNLPSATGGSPVLEYLISYNEKEDFTGYDSGEQTTTVKAYTLSDLTQGRIYYIRILARNQQGSGFFCGFTEANCIPLYGSSYSLGAHTPVTATAAV